MGSSSPIFGVIKKKMFELPPPRIYMGVSENSGTPKSSKKIQPPQTAQVAFFHQGHYLRLGLLKQIQGSGNWCKIYWARFFPLDFFGWELSEKSVFFVKKKWSSIKTAWSHIEIVFLKRMHIFSENGFQWSQKGDISFGQETWKSIIHSFLRPVHCPVLCMVF